MGRVVLHLGLPKTGTSFLQGVLRANEEELTEVIHQHFVRHLEPFGAQAQG